MNHLLSRQNKGNQTPTLTRRLNRRLRATLWQDDVRTVLLTPTPSFSPLKTKTVCESLEELQKQDVVRCMTPAIARSDAQPFLEAGFTLKERLHLLSHMLSPSTLYQLENRPATISIRPARRWHEKDVLTLDNQAFDSFWSFNRPALQEALRATPSTRYRVAVRSNQVVGYAVTGQATNRGYLQRLAVDPTVQGQHIGTILIYDALRWLQQRGSTRVFVNTQETNTRAFRLYKYLGFSEEKHGLVVLNWELPA